MSLLEDTDLYGFPIKLSEQEQAERKLCDAASEKEQHVWMQYIEKDRLPTKESKTKDMIRKGVAPTCRTWIWTQSSGAVDKKAAHASNYYQLMVQQGASCPQIAEIEQDVTHTFPNHSWLASEDGQAALKRVLSAYAAHNERIGYCRPLSNVVAVLLVAMNRNEENAFWILAGLVEDILYPGFYSKHLEGCQVEMKALDELLQAKLPRIHEHFQNIDCDISLLATEWYLSLYSTSLPSESVARVWDALFSEGPKILFRVALALFKIHEEPLLRINNAGDVVMFMREACLRMHNRDALMMVAFEGLGSLGMATIDKFRELKAQEVAQAMRVRSGGGAAGQVPEPGSAGKSEESKPKGGLFGKLMSSVNKLADKAGEHLDKTMAKAVDKMGITE